MYIVDDYSDGSITIYQERNLQLAIIEIKEKFGKNAIFKGMNKLEKATTIKRNTLVGGHNAN